MWNKRIKSKFQGRTLRQSSDEAQVIRTSFPIFSLSWYLVPPSPLSLGNSLAKGLPSLNFTFQPQRRRECHKVRSHLDPFAPPTKGPSHMTRMLLLAKEKERTLCQHDRGLAKCSGISEEPYAHLFEEKERLHRAEDVSGTTRKYQTHGEEENS